jgi:hypothetical protein
MSPVAYVALGGALGSALAVIVCHSAPSRPRVLALNAVVCLLMGAFAAAAPRSAALTALLGYGVLSNAGPLTSVLLPLPVIREPRDMWRLARRASFGLATNGLVSAAFAMTGYLAVRFGVTLYQKLTWY